MQNELTIQQHDANKKCDNLTQKFQRLLDVVDINDFFEKSLEFLSLFKSIIDNNPNIRKNLEKDVFVLYVINLRNYQQHHESSYKETIEKNSVTNIGGNAIVVGSRGTLFVGITNCNGQSESNIKIINGRNINGGNSVERKFEINYPFNFNYTYKINLILGTLLILQRLIFIRFYKLQLKN